MMTIVETTANQFFRVWETGDQQLAHVWYGIEVKRSADGQWIDKRSGKRGKLNIDLVRKAATHVIQS